MYKPCDITYSAMWISPNFNETRIYSTHGSFLDHVIFDLVSFANKNFGRWISEEEPLSRENGSCSDLLGDPKKIITIEK